MYFKQILKFGCLPLFLTICQVRAIGQTKTVTGVVVSDSAHAPIEGVTVTARGSAQATTTDKNGRFTLKAPAGKVVLTYSYVGFERGETTVPESGEISILMKKLDLKMDEVVVVGYGSQKKSKLTGAVVRVNPEEIQDLPVANIAAALRGRVAGLGVSQVSGRPGAGITLNIRDAQANSLTGGTAEPLYVIDNMIVGKSTFDNLDPSMVEDISILKDASAAIYGAAGAKGVVLITTKKGKAGPPRISYNGYLGQTNALKIPEMLSAYDHARLLNENLKRNNTSINNFFSEEDLEKLKTMNHKSWFDELWKPAIMQRHNLNVSGGTDRLTFFMGGGYQNQQGNYAGQKVDKYTFRSGITAKLFKGFRAEVNTNIDNNISYSKNGLSDNDKTFLQNVIVVPQWVPIKIGDNFVNYASGSNNFNNPLAVIASGFYNDRKARTYGLNGSLIFAPESGILKGLTARVQASTTAGVTRFEEYRPSYLVTEYKMTGNNGLLYTDTVSRNVERFSGSNSRLVQRTDESSNYRVFFTTQYARSFGQHDLNVILGGEQSAGSGTGVGLIYLDQKVENNPYYWAFDPTPTVETPKASQSTKRSFFGNFNYTFAGKYTLEGTTRLDASSNFAAANVWGLFPRLGAGWEISKEPFFKKKIDFINYLKLRANYGITGDDRVGSTYWFERYKINIGSYLYAESYVPGVRPDVYPNPDITWEKKATLNVGMDLALFKNKLNLGFEAFQDRAYDVFDKGNDANFPIYAGFAAPVLNYRIRHTWGTEYSIGYNTNFGRDIKFRANMNFGFGNSVMERMFYNRYELWQNVLGKAQTAFGTDPRIYNGANIGLKAKSMFRTQEEVDAFLAKNPKYSINGQVPQPGWLIYEDTNGDGMITDSDNTLLFDRVNPALVTGMQLGVTYKSLDLRVNIGASIGGKAFYDADTRSLVPSTTKNVPAFWTDTWSETNPDAKFPRYDDPFIKSNSNFWAVNGTTIRVNDLTLGYAAPSRIMKRTGFNSARVLLTANNLWTLVNPLKYKDPDTNSILDYPTMRTVSVGLSLGL
ncbi:SusC/RagA family TonB-linked outer membrane protein [Paraflavisolibacter sp. H34]|uniref:SusC/RagA family TonB-linked outer membrane protein n=1 Tax=Huijunlia imazamoxiresistens TaxID=3127457 RepID=UPI0030190A37